MSLDAKVEKVRTDELQTGITRKTAIVMSEPLLQAVISANSGIPTVLKKHFTLPGRVHCLRRSQ